MEGKMAGEVDEKNVLFAVHVLPFDLQLPTETKKQEIVKSF